MKTSEVLNHRALQMRHCTHHLFGVVRVLLVVIAVLGTRWTFGGVFNGAYVGTDYWYYSSQELAIPPSKLLELHTTQGQVEIEGENPVVYSIESARSRVDGLSLGTQAYVANTHNSGWILWYTHTAGSYGSATARVFNTDIVHLHALDPDAHPGSLLMHWQLTGRLYAERIDPELPSALTTPTHNDYIRWPTYFSNSAASSVRFGAFAWPQISDFESFLSYPHLGNNDDIPHIEAGIRQETRIHVSIQPAWDWWELPSLYIDEFEEVSAYGLTNLVIHESFGEVSFSGTVTLEVPYSNVFNGYAFTTWLDSHAYARGGSAVSDMLNTARLVGVTLPDGTPLEEAGFTYTFASGATLYVPEPSTVTLLLTSLVLCGLLRTRRRAV